MTLGTRLRKSRQKRRLSQAEVAELVGISQTTYYNWEADVSGMRIDYLPMLLRVLDIDIDELLPEITVANTARKQTDGEVRKNEEEAGQQQLHDLYKDLLSSKDEVIKLLKQENEVLRIRNVQLEETQKAA
ncbi:helix-turn-helix transcriptional regulator [Spirosoma sp. SC4-14]|uniref:helix-turn-helix domain-containing protein n=1 Tax=Spirosoma sp. SC4-14 TaxID=3128900 RepID=UPI0030D45593